MEVNTTEIPIVNETDEAKKQSDKFRMAKARRGIGKKKKVLVQEMDTFVSLGESDNMSPLKRLVVPTEDTEITWFSEVDLNAKGQVSTDQPAFCFDIPVAELKEDIRATEIDIDNGVYDGPKKRQAIKTLEAKKARYDKIIAGKPVLTPAKKDKVYRSFQELASRIRESLFTRDEMWTQRADAHEEARRMTNPCIAVNDPVVASYVRQRGMRMENGKINRNDASVIYKTMAKLLGEKSDIESLRAAK